MCMTCSNTGVVHTEIYPGMVTVKACTCEIAKQQEATQQERWEAWLQRFAEWEKGSSVSNVVRGYPKGKYAV